MKIIECPNCKKEFEISDNNYAAIVKQVRGQEFERELELIKNAFQAEKAQAINELKAQHQTEIQKMDDVIAQYRDFKIKLDNKSLGESLEQYCLHEFENIRGLLSPKVSFEKDNEAKKGETKGDFIYREEDESGIEILSIMFEMKTEFDDSSNKKKNADHLAKLDKDRKNKACEYAVLVTMLEPDNEYYNRGIVKAPGEYEKMYVVRPQCFLTIVSILRNAAMNTLKYKRTIENLREERADLNAFEKELNQFKNEFKTSVEDAANNYNAAIQELNKAIASLERIRDSLLAKSGKKLNAAARKVDKLTVKKLTKNAPVIRTMFEELEETSSVED